ncbi:MAG: M28 family peptidase [Halioglobus sp.]
MVAAHLDSWDLGTGAIDDGAGVAIVVGAAQLLLQHLPAAPAHHSRGALRRGRGGLRGCAGLCPGTRG